MSTFSSESSIGSKGVLSNSGEAVRMEIPALFFHLFQRRDSTEIMAVNKSVSPSRRALKPFSAVNQESWLNGLPCVFSVQSRDLNKNMLQTSVNSSPSSKVLFKQTNKITITKKFKSIQNISESQKCLHTHFLTLYIAFNIFMSNFLHKLA